MNFASVKAGIRVYAAVCLLLAAVTSVQAQVRQFDIPEQAATMAIPEFARQAGIQIIAPASGLEGTFTPALRGSHELRDALRVLLQNTGLEIASDDGNVITLRRRTADDATRDKPPAATQNPARVRDTNRNQENREPVSEAVEPRRAVGPIENITVTGTRIRGAQPSSPLVTMTGEEMRLAGHANLGEAVRAMPQNFVGGQNPGVTQGATGGGFTNQNVTGSSSLNLRGLGPDATLTLLNGARLPYDGFFQATDVAVVPVAAIDRMEVLLDGASAIYGSDAVGGVANIILRRDYHGAEISARYGGSTSGGYTQTQFTAVGGINWRSGGVLVAGESTSSDPILARHRDYLSYMPNPEVRIHPEIKQDGVLMSAFQNIGTAAQLAVDTFYTERRMVAFDQQTPLTFADDTRSMIWGVSPALEFDLSANWSLRAHGFIGQNERDGDFTLILIPTGQALIESSTCYCTEARSVGIEVEGPVYNLPAGDARMSAGAGYRKNEFSQNNLDFGTVFISGTRRSRYAFVEVGLPLVSSEQDMPGIARLSLNGAVRYEDYGSDDFGSVSTPKVGLVWGIAQGLDFRVSWGESFKTPTLVQQNQRLDIALSPASLFGVSDPADATVLRTLGGNPNLGPERAETLTAGFIVAPKEDFRVEITGFHIDYKDRVTTPITPFTAALSNPAFGDFVIFDPDLAQQEAAIAAASQFIADGYDPDNVIAIVFNNNTNVARQKVKGLDISTSYSKEFGGGELLATGAGSWLDSERRLTPLAPAVDTSGSIYFPAKFRGRGGINWARNGLTLAGYVNYIDGVRDTNATPSGSGASMTTVDAVLNYEVDFESIGSTRFNLAVRNLFNRRPPYLAPTQEFLVNYDSTNYSAIGRVISATVAKEF